ncbi:MAG: hypothetical protein HY816_02210 [Candidatus Wallbacteria bacterium]|nr:hypothetical protein [Candidatus Wallbacteria bacterium]
MSDLRPAAEGSAGKPAASALPGLREVLLALFFLGSLTPVVDYDVWLHLAAGREMWSKAQVLSVDVFSHTVPGEAWVYHEWLAAVVSYGLWLLGGVNALVVFKAVMMTASMGVLLATFAVRGHGRGAPALVGLMAAAVSANNVALERPHLFTILFLNLFVYWLNRQRYRGMPLPWGMAVIAALWANLHGGFVLGLLAFGPFLVEDLWHLVRRRGPVDGQDEALAVSRLRERILRTALVLAACVFATLANPYGVETLLYPLQYASPSPFMRQIEEWASPNFQRQIVLEAVLLVLVAVGVFSKAPVGLADGIFAMASVHLILTGVRNSFLVGSFLGPALVSHVAACLEQPSWGGRLRRKLERFDSGTFGPLLALAVLLGGTVALTGTPRVAPGRFPEGAVRFLERQRPPGRLFNDYDFGGYLMFHLPAYPVFVDGRVDVYSKHSAFADFLSVWHLSADWERVLERRGVRIALLEQRQSLAALLGASPNWQEVFRDDVAVIFLKR